MELYIAARCCQSQAVLICGIPAWQRVKFGGRVKLRLGTNNMTILYQCTVCGELWKRQRDDCPWCGSIGIIWVLEEDDW
jgi:hypothetical protein